MTRLPRTRLVPLLALALAVGSTLTVDPAGATPDAATPDGAVTPTAASTPGAGPTVSAAADDGVADDRVLVTVTPGTTDGQAHAIASRAGATLDDRSGTTLILDPTGAADTAVASTALATTPGVVAVEPNLRVSASAVPNDPYWTQQYGLRDNQPGGIRAQSAWNDTRGSRDVVVGVLDSGIALTHPDLVANLWTNRTGIGGCAYGTHGYDAVTSAESGHGEDPCVPSDDDGHGTHVAGILGATGDNGRGVTGVAQKVSIMSLRTLFYDPLFGASGSVADAVKAIDWALAAKNQGVNLRVLQASWGRDSGSVALSQAIARANAAGVLFVTAAGNGEDVAGPPVPIDLDAPLRDEFPCEDPGANVICVAATTPTDTLANFSNFGATAVDIAAPGVGILSTVPTGFFTCSDPSYCAFDGTSMAAPMVSGAAVDILAAYPSLSVSALRAQILASVDAVPSLAGKVVANGRLDLCKAIPNCDGRPSTAPTVPTDVRAHVGDGTATVSWGAPDSNGNSFLVAGYDVEGPNGTTSFGPTVSSATLTGLTDNVTTTVRVRASGAAPGPWATVTIRPYAGGFELDGLGVLHRVTVGGRRPSAASGPALPPGLARGVAILPSGTGGYVADAYGGLHPFAIGSASPMPPPTTGGPYWPGWDIVRGVALAPDGPGGYVIDGYGGIHPFGLGAAAPAAVATSGPYWNGFDIARGIAVAANGRGGYVVDGFGAPHPFASGGGAPPATTGGPYWPGWDITRGITLVPGSGGGWVLDGFGGPHPFASTGAAPGPPGASPYWPGWDIARGVDL